MGLQVTAEPEGVAKSISLAQLSDAVERATRECIEHGIDPHSIEPKTLNRLGGTIRKLTIQVG